MSTLNTITSVRSVPQSSARFSVPRRAPARNVSNPSAEATAAELRGLRVAVVHDWLTGMRGGEKVLEAILALVPHAEIYTLFHFEGSVSEAIERHTIHTSTLQSRARRIGDYRRLLPLFPRAAESWDLHGFDLVISSSHCVAKGVESGAIPHVSYCHTPMRYIWDRFDDYFPLRRPLLRVAASTIAPALRRWDTGTADRVDRFVANSEFVRQRIREYYGRESVVVHPFVAEEWLDAPLEHTREDHHVILSALVPYKKIDLAVEAAVRAGRRLVIVGDGPLREALAARCGSRVETLGWLPQDQIRRLIGRAKSLIVPGVEDFGITALEALASGTPVIGADTGGVRDSIVEGTGLFFETGSVESLAEAMVAVEGIEWDRGVLRARAREFGRDRFTARFAAVLREALAR